MVERKGILGFLRCKILQKEKMTFQKNSRNFDFPIIQFCSIFQHLQAEKTLINSKKICLNSKIMKALPYMSSTIVYIDQNRIEQSTNSNYFGCFINARSQINIYYLSSLYRMVLAQLGRKITSALQKFNKTTVINEQVVKDCLKEICNALLSSDIDVRYVMKLRENIMNKFKTEQQEGGNLRILIKSAVIKQLTGLLEVDKKPYEPKRGKTNIIMFVGLQGSGKTTTCSKVAYYYKKKGWRVAMVCADTFRAGAFDQLKQNAAKIRVPFYGSYIETDPVTIAEEGVAEFKQEGMEIIIVDTSGRHKQETQLFDEMKQVEKAVQPDNIIFVMDSSIGQQCYAQAEAFRKAVNVGSVIITKMDGHSKGGGALSAVAATKSPIIFIGDGEHFENLEVFDALSFIKRLLGEGDIKQLMERVKDAVSAKDQQKLLQKVKKGQFTIRDLRGQFESILKLGSLNSFLSLLPGAGTNLINKDNEKQSIQRIKRFIYIMDSMTPDQLDKDTPLIEQTRIKRIARGSGTRMQEVRMLLEEHKKLKGLISKVGATNLGKGGDKNMMRNPNQFMGKLQSMLDPKMMAQLGGAGNLMNMMKEMSSNPDLQKMMGSMGGDLEGLAKKKVVKIKK